MRYLIAGIGKAGQYHALISNGAQARLCYEPHQIGFVLEPFSAVAISPLAVDAFFATVVQRLRQLAVDDSPLVMSAELARSAPTDTTPWQHALHTEALTFGTQNNVLWLQRRSLDQSLLMASSELQQANETAVKDYLQGLQALGWRARVEQAVLSQLASGEPTLAIIAAELATSGRSLRRYLAAENTSFRDCVQRVRQHIACRLLARQRPLPEVAERLGFSDTNNFSRAFQRWTGQRPGRYQRDHRHED